MKNQLLRAVLCCTMILGCAHYVMAQPSFPANPNQAPIDGGLGMLAAAGGMYAYKKLKNRKDTETDTEM